MGENCSTYCFFTLEKKISTEYAAILTMKKSKLAYLNESSNFAVEYTRKKIARRQQRLKKSQTYIELERNWM